MSHNTFPNPGYHPAPKLPYPDGSSFSETGWMALSRALRRWLERTHEGVVKSALGSGDNTLEGEPGAMDVIDAALLGEGLTGVSGGFAGAVASLVCWVRARRRRSS
jgi:hypothetical protein